MLLLSGAYRSSLGAFWDNVGHLHLKRYLRAPQDSRLWAAIRAFERALRFSDDSDLRWRLSFAEFTAGNYSLAAQQLAQAGYSPRGRLLLPPEKGAYHWVEGLIRARAGEWDSALKSYRKALTVEPGRWNMPLYVQYYEAMMRGDVNGRAVAARVLGWIEETDAEVIHGTDGPVEVIWIDIPFEWNREGRSLKRFSYDQEALDRGPLVPARLSWEDEAGRILIQNHLLVNLAPNAGFEWGVDKEKDGPWGYTKSIYHDSSCRLLVQDEKRGRSTTVAGLVNSAAQRNSSFSSAPIRLERGRTYLQGGWLHSPTGLGYLGHLWGGKDLHLEVAHDYIVGTLQNEGWTFYFTPIKLKEGAQYLDIWMLNYNSDGDVFFDDIMLLDISFWMDGP